MLSIARSRLALPTQLSFLGLHAVGLSLGTVYTIKTPDLYENNAHNNIGWMVTWIVVAQCIIGLVDLAANFKQPLDINTEEQSAFLPISTQALAQDHATYSSLDEYRYSRDSGHYTASEASLSQSVPSMQDQENEEQQKFLEYQQPCAETSAKYTNKQAFLGNTKARRAAICIATVISRRTMRALTIIYNAIDCVSLLLGFVAVVSGLVVYGGVFVSHEPSDYDRYRWT